MPRIINELAGPGNNCPSKFGQNSGQNLGKVKRAKSNNVIAVCESLSV